MGGPAKESPTATLAYADRPRAVPVKDTVVSPSPVGAMALGETVAAPSATKTTASLTAVGGAVRSTVLPRIVRTLGAASQVVVEGKPRYEAVRPLGAGAQAQVTLARDHDIDRAVALKQLLPEQNDDASVLRFTEEIRTVGQLEHPNIVPIHDVGVDESGRYFFVMKYVEGETMESIIERLRSGDPEYARRYTPEYRLQICNEVLRAVEHAHELGVIHRDLKPGNVMIGSLGEVVVMDWGLAKRIDDPADPSGEPAPAMAAPAERPVADSERARLFQTQTGALLGTPAYMAPEQAAGKLDAVDARSDVYSLAVMFYEFISLTHPRAEHQTVAEMIVSVVHDPVPLFRVLGDFGRVGAPATLAHFVRHGLERDPAARYASVRAMRERLDAVRDGRAPIECHVTFTHRVLRAVTRTADRHPYLLLGLFGATAVGLVGGAVQLVSALLH